MESEYIRRTGQLIEYIKIHIISLEQDLETYYSEDDGGYLQTMASIETVQHLLEVANDNV